MGVAYIIAYVFVLRSEIRTNLSYGHPLIPRCPDKRNLLAYVLRIASLPGLPLPLDILLIILEEQL